MKKIILIVAAAVMSTAAMAAELTLNDLPDILQKLRGCKEKSAFSFGAPECRIARDDLVAMIRPDGAISLMRSGNGDTIFARGKTVTEVLQNFATQLNRQREDNKTMLDALGPLLPTQ